MRYGARWMLCTARKRQRGCNEAMTLGSWKERISTKNAEITEKRWKGPGFPRGLLLFLGNLQESLQK